MTVNKLCKVFVLFALSLVLLAPSAWPQASTGTVSGTVRDQTGAVVPAANVSLTNTGTNVESKTTTNQVGLYFFPGVVPGPYRLVVEAPGMQKFEGSLTVQVQQSAVVDVALKVGQATTEVQVTDVTPLLTTDTPTLSHTLERQRIEQLPINGRFITSLLQTVAGIELDSSDLDVTAPRAFGMKRGSAEFVLDGAATTDRLAGGVFRRPVGLDAIQEFRVESNVSSAKLPRPTTIIMSTKNGTNQLHGSAFETMRNNGIGVARSRTDFYTKPPELVRNEFGASAGGPVYIPKIYNGKNRTFWFFSYEGLRDMEATTQGFSLPTVAMSKGDFTGLIDPSGIPYQVYDPYTTNPQTWARQQLSYNGQLNVIDPARESPLAKYLFSITPQPTNAANPLVAPNFFGPQPNRRRTFTTTTRIDHKFTDKDQFYGRYTQGNYSLFSNFYNFASLNNVGGTINRVAPNKAGAGSWVHTFSPTFFNEVLVSGSSEHWTSSTGQFGVAYNDQLGLPNPNKFPGWPAMYYLGSMGDWQFESENTQTTPFAFWIADDNATKIVGKHELQFGFHYRWDKLDTLPEQQYTQGEAQGNSIFTSLYDPTSDPTNPLPVAYSGDNTSGTYLGLLGYWVQLGHPYFRLRAKEYAGYFQDNWKVSPRLTLNLGLRWDRWPPNREIGNLLTTFDPANKAVVLGTSLDTMYQLGATLPSVVQRLQSLGVKFETYQDAGLPQTLYRTPNTDFGPRLGFAYRLTTGNRATVLRGGYRISHFSIPLRAWTAQQRSNVPYFARLTSYINSSALSPDGINNYYMRSVPTIVAGVNSVNAINLNNVSSIVPGSPSNYYFDPSQPDTRIHDWNMTLEKEVMANTVVRASYVGNHSSNLQTKNSYNDSTPTYIYYVTTGQPLPTGTYANVLLRPFDQTVYGTLQEYGKYAFGNFNGMTLEAERRYSGGYSFQLIYTLGNALASGGDTYRSVVNSPNSYLPGAVPADFQARSRFLNYSREADTANNDIPKQRVRWNWLVDLPVGKGKRFAGKANGALDKVIGGWQLAGLGNLRSTYFALPTSVYPNGTPVTVYGYKYPIQDCRSGVCTPGYLWWNGYIPANLINSHDPVTGLPNGVEGVPPEYKPAGQPLWPWPANPSSSNPLYRYYGTNTVWVPLKNGTVQRLAYNDNLNPWRNQYVPGVLQWGLDASLFKSIPFKERYNIRFNADFFNVLNHPGNPNAITGDGILSTIDSGQAPRVLQLTLRLSW